MTDTSLQIIDTWVVYDRSSAMMPSLAYTTEGELLASYHTIPDGLPGGEVYIIRSSDHGRTWGEPQLVAQSRKQNGTACSPLSLRSLRNGTLLLPFRDEVRDPEFAWRDITLYILRSTDHGRTWERREKPVAVDVHESGSYGQIIERPDGTLLCPVFGRYHQEDRWHSAVLFSYDDGQTWEDYTTIAYDPKARLTGEYTRPDVSGADEEGEFDLDALRQPNFRPHSPVDGFNETSIILLADGRLLAILRQQGVERARRLYFYRALSEDGGRTWSPYQRTNLCGMSPCLHYSPQEQLLLGYRRCAPETEPHTRPGLSVARSQDYGLTWVEVLTLKEPKSGEYIAEYQVGYPSMINHPDGSILIVYYSYDETLSHRRYLAANLLREIG